MPDESPPRGAAGEGGAPNVLSPIRYLAWLYSQPAQQPAIAALLAIESEVAASLRPGIDHHVAHARLQWWRDESERSARGQPVHPLTRELLKAHRSAASTASAAASGDGVPSPAPDISGFIDTAVWDLASATFATRRELTAYSERWAAAMFEPVAAVPGSISPMWRTLGAAVREIELLANLGTEAHAGRLRVPLDELEQSGVDPQAIPKPPWPAPLAALLRERHVVLQAAIANGLAALDPDAQTSTRGLMVWVALAWRMSLRAQGALPDMVAPRRYHALADGWQAWRAARRATTGSLRLN
jgi:phytoene synthase